MWIPNFGPTVNRINTAVPKSNSEREESCQRPRSYIIYNIDITITEIGIDKLQFSVGACVLWGSVNKMYEYPCMNMGSGGRLSYVYWVTAGATVYCISTVWSGYNIVIRLGK